MVSKAPPGTTCMDIILPLGMKTEFPAQLSTAAGKFRQELRERGLIFIPAVFPRVAEKG